MVCTRFIAWLLHQQTVHDLSYDNAYDRKISPTRLISNNTLYILDLVQHRSEYFTTQLSRLEVLTVERLSPRKVLFVPFAGHGDGHGLA